MQMMIAEIVPMEQQQMLLGREVGYEVGVLYLQELHQVK
jgi:hypothetical protein